MATSTDAGRSGLKTAEHAFRAALSDMCRDKAYKGLPRGYAVSNLEYLLRRFKSERHDPADVLDRMIDEKVVYEMRGRILPASRGERRTAEERRDSFEEWVSSVSARATDDTEARSLLATLIRRMTRLHGVHRISTERGKGFIIPTDMAFVGGHPVITKARAVIIGTKLRTYKLAADRIALDWSGDWPILTANLSDLRTDGEARKLLDRRIVGKHASFSCIEDSALKSAAALRRLVQDREAVESFIGLTLAGNRWNGLKMSLRRAKPIGTMASRMLLGMLDPEVRRIALRNPYADLDFYFWLLEADAETSRRRAQMSEAFPLFTCHMRALDAVIRDGRPLLPALQEITGLDIPRLKKLRGVHWQRLGSALRLVLPDDGYGDCSSHLKVIDTSRWPRSRNEWVALNIITHWNVPNMLPKEKRPRMFEAMSSNLIGYKELALGDIGHAIADCADSLVSLMDHHLSTTSRGSAATNDLARRVLELVAGDTYGLKRLRRFNDAWHKGAGQRTMKMRALKRTVFGDERIASWRPLTEDGYECPSGRLVWLTDEDQLALEGQKMHHCVGTYWYKCLKGRSHIAEVHGFDGTRSTVEIGLSDGGRASELQHYTFYDKVPTDACMAVVSSFLRANRKTVFEIVGGDEGFRHSQTHRAKLTEEQVGIIKEAYSDCLPQEFLDGLENLAAAWRERNPDLPVEKATILKQERGWQRQMVGPPLGQAAA